jgi:hypothetical protein
VTGNTCRKLSRVPQTAQTDYAAELAIGNPVQHLAHRRHWRPIEQAFNDPVYAGEPLEKTLGVCADQTAAQRGGGLLILAGEIVFADRTGPRQLPGDQALVRRA